MSTSETTHGCPPTSGYTTWCCGKPLSELPSSDRVTLDPELVTCVKVKIWPCGCWSDNAILRPCDEHVGSVGTKNLRADDPRLNVVFGPSKMTLHFLDSQGKPGKHSALLSREALLKVMGLMGELDETPEEDDE